MIQKSLQHLAIIMDGNRRWAVANKVSFLYANKSREAVRHATTFCLKNSIPYLSLYTFSLENLHSRDALLRKHLFSILKKTCVEEKESLVKQGVSVRFVGQRDLFPDEVRTEIELLETATAGQSRLHLQLLFCYGAQQELAVACKRIAHKVAQGHLGVDQITPAVIDQHLWTSGIPHPELILRTSGVKRLSNFLLFQAAYSELLFLDVYWPEVTEHHLHACVEEFRGIVRNFGR